MGQMSNHAMTHTCAPVAVMLFRERSTAVTVAFWSRASVKQAILLSSMSQFPRDTHNSSASLDFSCSTTVSNLQIFNAWLSIWHSSQRSASEGWQRN